MHFIICMGADPDEGLIRALADAAHPLVFDHTDYDPLLELVGDSPIVLLGESTHGSHEHYRERAQITKRLILEKGFTGVAVEADWPDASRVNRFVRGRTYGHSRREAPDTDAEEALRGFHRFPAWMWRNADVVDFVGWLRAYHEALIPDAHRVGFYGLDLYALHASMAAVIDYLERHDPGAAVRARERYACLEPALDDPIQYSRLAALGRQEGCEAQSVAQVVDLQLRAMELATARRSAGKHVDLGYEDEQDDAFDAEQNACLVRDAEVYYRTMSRGRESSWNLRDSHMANTLDDLLAHLGRGGRRAKVVVWAHNSHIGDARATDMARRGELNLGQLARQRHGDDVVSIGFGTYAGTVTAASEWGEDAERKVVRPSLAGSTEALFHHTGIPRLFVDFRDVLQSASAEIVRALREPRLTRAIGVIYRPESERTSHYFHAVLPDQFDAVVYFDRTRAVEPLERTSVWDRGEAPETYPSAL